MLIVALVLAVIGLAALVTAVVTSNEIVAWVCIAASSLGVVVLIVDAVRERQNRRLAVPTGAPAGDEETAVIDAEAELAAEDHSEEVVGDGPEYDTYGDDEPEHPQPAEESALESDER